MKVSHRPAELFASFDAPDLIAHAGLIPTIRLAERCGLPALVAEKVKLTGAKNGAGTAADAKALTANAAWLTLAAAAYNLTRAAGHLASVFHAKARTGTIRRHLINVPARIATGARRITLHLPQRWRWEHDFADLWTATGQRMVT